ncbi:MAG: DUF4432 family protein [Chloroflexota bacterium]|nr:DUF4432 family protein [Chloroflexota bacterium]
MPWETILHLHDCHFGDRDRLLAEHEDLSAGTFRYRTGVAALILSNRVGTITVLPFQGQQIWDAEYYGRALTMKSMFDVPFPTTDYLRTYGGFLLHCGATAMGVPSAKDTHPLHGELPNAPYQSARLLIGEDERGSYLGVTGDFQYTVAFSHNYVAEPTVKIYQDSSRISVSMIIRNLKHSDMELMYLAHANFRPLDNSQLVYSAPCTPEHVRVRSSIPSHIRPPAGYRDFLAELEADPSRHNLLAPDLAFDPEVVFYVDYLADEQGWAHSMQVHPSGSADFISHRPDQLDHGVRWISRTADQDGLGIILPATAEPEGYSAEMAKGNIKTIAAGEEFRVDMEMGALQPDEAAALQARIGQILGG